MLMQELGICGCDDFEKQLVEFLESGLFEKAKIEAIIERYIDEKETLEARASVQQFLEKSFWDSHIDETELVTEAATLLPSAVHLDPFVATELAAELAKLPGGASLGEAIIDAWIKEFKKSPPAMEYNENPFGQPLHSKIQAEFALIETTAQANTTAVEACMHIIDKGGWGTLQEIAMRQATTADFEMAIREMKDLKMFRRFMRRMIEMRLQKAQYEQYFGSALERFMDACRKIANDTSAPRLANIIKRIFERTALVSELGLLAATPNQSAEP